MNNLLRLLLKKHLWKYKKIIENTAEPSALARSSLERIKEEDPSSLKLTTL